MYFKNFPKVILDAATGPTAGAVIATDILRRVGFNSKGQTGSYYFVDYDVQDHDTPESIADVLYGSPEYHWVVLLFNNMFDGFFDWPLNARRFEKHKTNKYEGISLFLDTEGKTGSFNFNDTVTKHSGTGVTGWNCIVKNYDPVLHKLTVVGTTAGNDFSVNDTVRAYNSTGGTNINTSYVAEATIKRVVTDSVQALHHFEHSGSTFDGYADVGGGYQTSVVWLDPLSKYDGITQVSLGSGGVTFGETLLHAYTFNGSNNYVKTNYDYELKNNESKRQISLLKPEFLDQVNREFKVLIRR